MQVHLISSANRLLNEQIMDDVYRLRNRVFNGWLGWDLPTEDGKEQDVYDQDAFHFVVTGEKQSVLGCWRIMPTEYAYMTQEVFPELFGERPPPKDKSIWDLSRFAVDRWKLAEDRDALERVLGALASAVFEFAITHGVAEMLSVQDPHITPIANRFLGDPVWSGPTLDAGATDATCYGYTPSLERLYALRTQFALGSPVIEAFQVCSRRMAA